MTERNTDLPAFLTPHEVAKRWRLSMRTLEGWRFRGIGPAYKKIGSKVLYPREVVLRIERDGSMLGGSDHE